MRTNYAAIGAEPWLYPYDAPSSYKTQEHGVVPATGALKTPLVLGPGWYKGAKVSYTPPAKGSGYGALDTEPFMSYIKTSAFQPAAAPKGVSVPVFPGPGWRVGPPIAYIPNKVHPMLANRSSRRISRSSYGVIGNFFGPPVGVGPVRDPVGGMVRPAGPVYPAPYVPSDLPIINPSPGYHIGPPVFNSIPVGMGYGASDTGSGDSLAKFAAKSAATVVMTSGFGAAAGLALAMGYLAFAGVVYPYEKRSAMGKQLADMGAYAAFTAPLVLGIGYGAFMSYAGYKKFKGEE